MEERERSGWVLGLTGFAAAMMVVAGMFQAVMGLVAIFNQDFYVLGGEYLFGFDVAVWGWIHLLWGIFLAATAAALFSGQGWARVVGVILAIFAALEAFLFIPYQPFWSVIVIALAVLVIWALTTASTSDLDDVRP
jgi:hypothetical protein